MTKVVMQQESETHNTEMKRQALEPLKTRHLMEVYKSSKLRTLLSSYKKMVIKSPKFRDRIRS